ncbi:MAG: hypothetical protein WBJ06_11065 [Candidatus Methanoculleus thermohydrogenotrophicum]|nr:hypothetical protein [Candidatus Methanoculleus thermohydrogenotrophicum]HPZ37771.1 hypothetical protein [Candidatus Methanoculleus thermohydrogenotrophicum]HQC91634.1 hypothetical protein [Candidatus Methanoculleus thermohydrogenotrophicum]
MPADRGPGGLWRPLHIGDECGRQAVHRRAALSGLGIAIVFSLVAGIYPARKATRMNPVAAIRGFA